jgi:Fe-S cluster assembly protein SufD
MTNFRELYEDYDHNSLFTQTERQNAIESFDKKGLPSSRLEHWHYTNVKKRMKKVFPLGDTSNVNNTASYLDNELSKHSINIFVINGVLQEDMGSMDKLPSGLEIIPIEKCRDKKMMELSSDDVMLDLNTAFSNNGFAIYVSDNTLIKPIINIIHINDSKNSYSLFQRNLIVIGKNSFATVLDTYHDNGIEYFCDNVTNIHICDNAKLDRVSIHNNNDDSMTYYYQDVAMDKSTSYTHKSFYSGSKMMRQEGKININGEHSTASIDGSCIVNNNAHCDVTLLMQHNVPDCTSSQKFRNVVGDNGVVSFQGNIYVVPKAQRTDANQSIKAVLISDDASHSSKPQLDIFADDVSCAHGATIGAIDQDAMFFLLSRGIDKKTAQSMLISAFVIEVTDDISDDILKDYVNYYIDSLL